MKHDELVDNDTAAEILKISPGTLPVWRTTGRYTLPFVKIGQLVRYPLSDLEDFQRRRTVNFDSGQANERQNVRDAG